MRFKKSEIQALHKAVRFLAFAQNPDGGWGGDRGVDSSVEETSLALAALAGVPGAAPLLRRGTEWLLDRLESPAWKEPSPIGLYFARLWYFERLYPLIFSVDALRRVGAERPAALEPAPGAS